MHRGLEVALPGVDTATGGHPPVGHRVEPEVGVEEEQQAVGVIQQQHPHGPPVGAGPVPGRGRDESWLAGEERGGHAHTLATTHRTGG